MTNLLFIFTDEQRADTINNPQLDMPNLNKLASQSTLFERAYCTQPICTPSRSSIMAGLYPHSTGCIGNNVPLPGDMPTIAEMLQDNFVTGYYGKWHLGDEIFQQHGFDHWISFEDNYIPYYSESRDRNTRSDYHHYLIEQGFETDKDGNVFSRGFAARLPEEHTKPAFLAREAARFIQDNRDNPFVLYVNFLEPHMPFYGPRDDQYDPDAIPMPPNFDNSPTSDQHPRAQYSYHRYAHSGFEGNDLTTDAGWRRIAANYWGLNSLIDTHTGVILDALENAGLTEDTIIVFTSDHGDQMGSHRLLAKNQIFEESVRVPLMIRLPGQTEGRTIANPISQIDLVPTLLDLLGQPVPEKLQGKSRRDTLESGVEPTDNVFAELDALVRDEEKLGGDYAFSQVAQQHTEETAKAALAEVLRIVITPDGWKLSHSPNGHHELYNLNDDPYELHNLASQEPDRVAALTDQIRAWQQETGDQQQ